MARSFGAVAMALSVAARCYGGKISAFRVSAWGVAPGGGLGRFFSRGASDQEPVETGGGAVGRRIVHES